MFRRTLIAAVSALAALGAPARARADEPPRPEKRAVPDYAGRPTEGSARRVALLPVRVLFFPVHAVAEYVVRRPLGAVVRWFDDDPANPSSESGWSFRPILVLDAGMKPRLGLHAIVAGDTHALRLRADTFGPKSFMVGVAPATWVLSGRGTLEVAGSFERRPDVVFHGIGARTTDAAERRLQVNRAALGYTFRTWLPFGLDVATGGGIRRVTTEADLASDYVAPSYFASIAYDRRELHEPDVKGPQPPIGSGLRVEADVESAGAVSPGRRWLSWGGALVATIHVGRRRFLELATAARFVDALGENAPPVLELASLGGDRWLRGHLAGRVRGPSTAVASLRWQWPIWIWLDGFVQVDAGNAFDTHLRDLSARLLRLSATMGMRNFGRSGYVFELLTGVGTETIEDGARISNVRVLVAATRPL